MKYSPLYLARGALSPTVTGEVGTELGYTNILWFDTTTNILKQTIDGINWTAIGAAVGGGGSDPWSYVKLAVDFATTLTAVQNSPLILTPLANINYEFEASLMIRTATATVNPRIGLSWPTGMTDGIAQIIESQAATGTPLFASGNINAALLVAVGGLPNTTQSWPVSIRGMLRAGAIPVGNLTIQLSSETAGTSVRIMTGSFIKYRTIP